MEKEQLSTKRKKYEKPIHAHDNENNEIIKCPYKCCTYEKPYNAVGRASMSRHMKAHSEKGTPLKPCDSTGTVIKLYDKYNEMRDLNEENNIENLLDSNDPSIASFYCKKSDDKINETQLILLKWRDLTDREFIKEVSFPVFAKAIIGYSINLRTYLKCSFVIAKEESKLIELEEKIASLKKCLGEYRNDTKKMSDIVLEKTTTLDGIMSSISLINEINKGDDLRRRITRETKDALQATLTASYNDYEKTFVKKVVDKVKETCLMNARLFKKFGVPVEGIFNTGIQELPSKEEIEENEMFESLALLYAKPKASRQLKASQIQMGIITIPNNP